MDLKSWNAVSLMEKLGSSLGLFFWLSGSLGLGHRKSKRGKDHLKVEDETKFPPPPHWTVFATRGPGEKRYNGIVW